MNNRLKAILLMSPLVFAVIIAAVVVIVAIVVQDPLAMGIILLFLLSVLAFLKGLDLYVKYEREGE